MHTLIKKGSMCVPQSTIIWLKYILEEISIAMIPKKMFLVLKNMIMVPMKMIIVPKKISAFMNYQCKESNCGQYVLSEVLTWYVSNVYNNILNPYHFTDLKWES